MKTPFIVHDDGNGDALYIRSTYIPDGHRMCLLCDGVTMYCWDDEPSCYRIDTLLAWYEKESRDCPNESVRTIRDALAESFRKFKAGRYQVDSISR